MMAWICVAFAGFSMLETFVPGWRMPRVRTWPVRVIAINAVQLGVVMLAGVTWERWFQRASIFGLGDAVPAWAAGLGAYFVATFVFYWWHRWRHESDGLWRHFHQIHHSARRLEVATSFYKHPLEMIVNSIIGAALVYGMPGLQLEAGAVYTLCTAAGEFFYHANWCTPHWEGRCGFVTADEERLGAMLAFCDVHGQRESA